MQQELLNHILTKLRGYAMKLCDGHLHDAEDLVQDTVERVLVHYERLFSPIPEMDKQRMASAFMHRIFVDKYRVEKIKKFLKPVELHDDLYNMPEEEKQEYDVAEYWDFILNHPNKAAMECFTLYIHGYKNREIAEGIGVSVNNILSNCLRAKREIQKHFGVIDKNMFKRKNYYIPKKTKPAA